MLKRTSLAILIAVAGCGDNNPSNFPPALTAQAIELTIAENGVATIDATAHDPEEDKVTYTASAPSHGAVSGTGPLFTYKPQASYVGGDSLTITVSDGKNQLEVPVAITVVAGDVAPVADAQAISVDRNASKAITLTGHDADDDDLIFEIATPPAHGTLTGAAPDLTYTPEPGYAGPDAFTFDVSDALETSAAATVTITVVAVTTCGDGLTEGAEQCDDGNDVSDDGCSNLCLVPACGDGVVQLDRGEECDSGVAGGIEGCSAACLSGAFQTVAPIQISNELCTTNAAATARKVSVDGRGTIYAIMRCGGEAEAATVVVSTDRGASYGTPVRLAAPGEYDSNVAIAAGPIGTAYAAIVRDDGQVSLRVTRDAGASWDEPVVLGTTSDRNADLSLVAFNDRVYVGFHRAGGLAIARNHHRATGPFATSSPTIDLDSIELLYDPTTRDVVAVGDSPELHLFASGDDGATFGAERMPGGSQFFSDWAAARGTVFAAGTRMGPLSHPTSLYVIGALGAATPVSGLPSVGTSSSRTVAADAQGDAFVGSQLDDGSIQLDRLPFGADAFDAPRVISASGDSPSVGPLPGQHGAAVLYSDGFTVWASVQSYDPIP